MVKILDRFLLFIYTLITLAASAVLLVVTFAWIPEEDTAGWLRRLYHDLPTAYTSIVLCALMMLISIRFLYVTLRRGRAQAPSIDQRTDFGDIRISLDTVENLALKAANRSRGVKDVKARVRVNPSGIEIVIRALVDGETSIPSLSEEMQRAVKELVEEITGIPVASVTVFVANIVQSAPTFKSRVE
ncbi:alkaline shock response membrane anchor protein AmaP [Paenibacillus chartarius]|uniref:Alkaline shock response membrane anchor protein AmaP n=1 Tax=Paenibacillus chartarius TaxID=747481 RepID=A0ABV6DNK3_9BACL